jgi:hypothetical protein
MDPMVDDVAEGDDSRDSKPAASGGIKNASSWSSLAALGQAKPSPAALSKVNTNASFEQFRKQAKDKEERVSAVMRIIVDKR